MNSNSENIYSKADRFAKLSEKLSQIQVHLFYYHSNILFHYFPVKIFYFIEMKKTIKLS